MKKWIKQFVGQMLGATALSLVCMAAPSYASAEGGPLVRDFVQIDSQRELYVEYQMPAEGKPTVVLFNGLTYATYHWNAFFSALSQDGIGILRFDPMGMGNTLLKYGPPTQPIHYKNQVEDLKLLLDALNIHQPIHILGLSYGGALAMEFSQQYPDRVESIIAIAPYVAPLEDQDRWIRMQIDQTRLLFPYNPATDEELYDYFLRMNVYSTYPAAEPSVLESPFKLEGVFRLVQGIRKFLVKDIVDQLPKGKLHLILARRDQYVSNSIHDEFWEQVPSEVRASRLYVEGSEHKIPQVFPRFLASWVRRIIDGDPEISGGKTFVGTPWLGKIE